MQNSKLVSDLLAGGSPRLGKLAAELERRSLVAEQVRNALPAELARHIATAGLDKGRLTIGVNSAAWASRLRYQTATLRKRVGHSLDVEITTVRIRVVPPDQQPDK
jgi:hypothetical protein